jgi:hypothetical protein
VQNITVLQGYPMEIWVRKGGRCPMDDGYVRVVGSVYVLIKDIVILIEMCKTEISFNVQREVAEKRWKPI